MSSECYSILEIRTVFVITKHQNLARDIFKVVKYCHVTFSTLATIMSIHFHQLLEGLFPHRYLIIVLKAIKIYIGLNEKIHELSREKLAFLSRSLSVAAEINLGETNLRLEVARSQATVTASTLTLSSTSQSRLSRAAVSFQAIFKHLHEVL